MNGPWIFQTWNPVTRRTSKLGSLQRVKFGTNRLNLKLLVSEQCFQFGWHARVCKTCEPYVYDECYWLLVWDADEGATTTRVSNPFEF